MQQFTEKVALIAGGTSGIGQTTAIAFAKLGAKVVVAGRSEDDGQETLRLIQETGDKGLFVKADLTQANDVELLVNKAVETYGRLDCAFNNAAVEGTLGAFIEQPDEEFDKVISSNLKSLGRSGQPEELAPAYVFLASNDSTFVTGSLLEVSGGLLSVE